jgi:hypothetical protein
MEGNLGKGDKPGMSKIIEYQSAGANATQQGSRQQQRCTAYEEEGIYFET